MGCHGLQSPAAVGVWATANFLALPLGPILGGWLLTNYWWGWAFLINVPVVLVGLLAVIVLLPESRSATRAGLDPVGVLSSSAGLAVLVYGVIEAGQHGWGDTMALTAMIAGTLLLVGFVAWERRLGRRPAGQPLVDLGLFRSTSFTWGTILAAVGIFALFGVLFTAPQYFQAVLGTDAMGSGLRLLPLKGGLAVAASVADRLAARAGAKVTAAFGFVLLAAGLGVGATTSVTSGTGYIAAWTVVVGLGMGLALATAASAALAALSAERAGVGSAVMQTVQKVGAPFAAAILGSVLNATYRGSCTWPACQRESPTRCETASSPGSRPPSNSARCRCCTRCAPPSWTAWMSCCGCAPASRWQASSSRWSSCPGGPPQQRQRRPSQQHWRMRPLSEDDRPAVGLRERKKAKTRAAIQQHALRLFREQGYQATTVEQIAEAAEVSPSTFFRYFPTKEDVVLYDALDPALLEAFRAQPAELSPIQALRGAMQAVFAELPPEEVGVQRERDALIRSVPELRARMVDEFARNLQLIAEVVAERVGRAADEPAVRTLAGAVIGVGISAWYTAGDHATTEDYLALMDAGLAHLEAGLPL